MKDTTQTAENLLGCYLVREIGGQRLIGRIVETEAYLGIQDSSCHSFKGLKTNRTKTMYLPGGHSYVYFTYGMYYCFNVVTMSESYPEAVLIRALEPIEALSKMKKYRNREKPTELCSGPGKLCQAFKINKSLNEKDLTCKGSLYICGGENTDRKKEINKIETDSRIGLPLYKDSSYFFLRFYFKNNPFVSFRKHQV